VAATSRWWTLAIACRQRLIDVIAGLLGGALATHTAGAAQLPEDRADAMVHVYDGGGVRASGPALLVRKNLADKVSLSASYYVDMVSNASIDVVTTASPFKETRSEYGVGVDYAYRDALMTLALSTSKEPDYKADAVNFDLAQDVFGGMTTVSLGFTRGADKVLRHNDPTFSNRATHWRYRLGATQVLTPRWLASVNTEMVADDGYLGSPYRAARVFGAAVPERLPTTRTSRAVQFRVVGDLGSRDAVRADYRYFWDTWDIRAHTAELGYSRYLGADLLADGHLRFNSQRKALFYSDNFASETTYITRNRQLGTFTSAGVGAKLSYTAKQVPGRYVIKFNTEYQLLRFRYSDFTDIRTGKAYSFDANVLEVFLSATF
jgi:hypothetical protein